MKYKIENITTDGEGNLINVKPQVIIPEEREVIDVTVLLQQKDALQHQIIEAQREVEKAQAVVASLQLEVSEIDAVINKGVELQVEKVIDVVEVSEKVVDEIV